MRRPIPASSTWRRPAARRRRIVQGDGRRRPAARTYRGQAPALLDLLGGQAQVMFDSLPAALEYLHAGKLRGLAVTARTRADALPDLPTVAEFVPGYESSAFYGFAAPAATPAAIVETLNREINNA